MYLPNGEGLWIPENIGRPTDFSVPDGTGYVRRQRCINTGINPSKNDRIIAPAAPDSGFWTDNQAGYWTQHPYQAFNIAINAAVATYMSLYPAVGDQWCVSKIDTLSESRGQGVGIGVMCRVHASGGGLNGYYAIGAQSSGSLRFELGILNNVTLIPQTTATWDASTYPVGLTAVGIKVTGKSTNGGAPGATGIVVTMVVGPYATFVSDIASFWTLGLLSFGHNPSTSEYDTGIPGALASSGSAAPFTTTAIQSRWLAGEIGGC